MFTYMSLVKHDFNLLLFTSFTSFISHYQEFIIATDIADYIYPVGTSMSPAKHEFTILHFTSVYLSSLHIIKNLSLQQIQQMIYNLWVPICNLISKN